MAIEGIVQGLRYGNTAAPVYFRLIRDGVDATITGTPTVTIRDPSGTTVAAAANLTQVGTTAVWTANINVSSATLFPLGLNYRATVSFVVSTRTFLEHWALDVVMWPINDPLISSQEVDEKNPSWAGKRPGDWTNWANAIEAAHVKLFHDIRSMRDGSGAVVYPHKVLDRSVLRRTAMAYTEREIALVVRMRDEERDYYLKQAENALPQTLLMDADDDLNADEDPYTTLSRSGFVR